VNAAFVSQGLGLRFLHQIAEGVAGPLGITRRGFYVCDAEFHRAFRAEVPGFAAEPHVLAEWRIMAAARTAAADLPYLRAREAAMAAGPLWDALVCDRRIMQGRWCKERQDYRPRFSHDALLRILTVALREIEAWLDAVSPDVIFGLVPVSFGEYLIWMAAQARGIPTLYLYPTKVFNYMCWMDSFFGRPRVIVDAYNTYRRTGQRDEWTARAEGYLHEAEGGVVRHEGMVPIPGKIAAAAVPGRDGLYGRVARLLRAEWDYRTSEAADDNHVLPPIEALWRRTVVARARRRRVAAHLEPRYLSAADLARLDFAFYPLHAEPEVALSIQGRPYVNQIETMRTIARSLPAGMLLVTKEHPRSIGYHPPSYYDKLLEIPNVRIADPYVESSDVIRHAALVTSVWSFVGFEAILRRKPLVSLGTPTFGVLPESMTRYVTNLHSLPDAIRRACDDYAYDRGAVVDYLAACMRVSTPVDFYARYLEKRGRYGGSGAADAPAVAFSDLIAYTARRAREAVGSVAPAGPGGQAAV
jgi:hypothetical protein